MRNSARIMFLIIGLFLLLAPVMRAQAAAPAIDVLTIKGIINTVVADYVKSRVSQAADDGASAVVIQIDTPGGLDTAMRDVVQAILGSSVPVIVYVAPSGARAASAGTYITLAGHVAAMAPNTAIGAATPVALGVGGEVLMSDEMKRKVINDATAYIRGIAQSRGRNVDWAEQAVVQGVSISAQEALDQHVVDMIAPDLKTLISQLDGREVTLLDGRKVTLDTKNATTNLRGLTLGEDLLNTISDPNIAYLLLGLAIIGIIVEVFHPGLIFPGVVGGISLFLALYALGMLPVNWAGVLLIVLAVGLFIAEVLTPGFGALFAGGLISLVIGSLILFKGGGAGPDLRVSLWLIVVVAILMALLFGVVIERVWKAHRRQAATGSEELIGKTAVVRQELDPEGMVFLEGELWDAISDAGKIEPGEEVKINKVEGLKLYVTKK